MLSKIIREKTIEWLQSADCSVSGLMEYIRNKGELRDTQIEAIETYLFLKIKCRNKPLWQLFSEGFFRRDIDLSQYNLNFPDAVNYLSKNDSAYSLFSFCSEKIGEKMRLSALAELILKTPELLDYESTIKKLFYNVSYSDYLMSLPMGAGKTFLMAAIIYLDLYFASNEPNNEIFAHNFLVLIPSGLKNSIGPSLRTIESFDPSWVIPQPYASELKRQLKFEVLDEQKTGKKSNKARNPNSAKVNNCLPDPFGQVFVVNAEKVILNKVHEEDLALDFTEDEEERGANELRSLIAKIPNFSILIDEVHHAAKTDIKLRQVVNKWNDSGNVTTVLGFSGTPYLSSAEKIPLAEGHLLKSSEITNTVYYYPLTRAIEKFLKNPEVKVAENIGHVEIVSQGIKDFNDKYRDLLYADGTVAKVAIYCSSIEMLEEEIYPFLVTELKISENEILRYHGGNSSYSIAKESELAFRSLDSSFSKIRYILLVAIGKEGWDCKSLTSVILPQKSKSSSKNAIIQTTCRCLRQVVKGNDETALVWLNQENAKILNKQLQEEQHTSIEELNQLTRESQQEMVERHSRMEFLKLPKIDYYQLQINYQEVEEEKDANTTEKIKSLFADLDNFRSDAVVRTSTGLDSLDNARLDFLDSTDGGLANYNAWIFKIFKESYKTVSLNELHKHDVPLRKIFDKVSFERDGMLVFDSRYDLYRIESLIRLSFSIKKHLKTDEEIVPQDADLLIIDKLVPVAYNKNLHPPEEVCRQVLKFDKEPMTQKEFDANKAAKIQELVKQQKFDEIATVSTEHIHDEVLAKDHTFHHLPYNFDSGFEMKLLQGVLKLGNFRDKNLEIYFNGERGLTEFVIECYAKKGRYWNKVGRYTADFLILRRSADQSIQKALIIETKGEAYADDKSFMKKRNFVETTFLQQNEEKFGYKRFDFIYLEDTSDLTANLAKLSRKINDYFKKI